MRMEGESTGKDNWNQGHLWDELETWCDGKELLGVYEGDSAKTPSNGKCRA